MKTELEKYRETLPPAHARAHAEFFERIQKGDLRILKDFCRRLELNGLERSKQNRR